MKEFLISPPVGNILSHSKCTSVVGTFTLNPRGSNWTKLYRLLKTTRPIKGGWVNNVGFQNPGISSVKKFHSDKIYSIGVAGNGEWEALIDAIPSGTAVEINVQCPNLAQHESISDELIAYCIEKFDPVIFKLRPTTDYQRDIDRYLSLNVPHLHLFNSLPSGRGGESGMRLQEHSLRAIRYVRQKNTHIKIVGGGGIYSVEDIKKYREAGADHFSLSSIFLDPLKAASLLGSI